MQECAPLDCALYIVELKHETKVIPVVVVESAPIITQGQTLHSIVHGLKDGVSTTTT